MNSQELKDLRTLINRENARKSTGPKTDAGKKRSSLNALRHGLTAQVVVLPCEDLAAYDRFTKAFHDELKPVGMLETQLTQSIADDYWRLNRAKAIEQNMYTLALHERADSIITDHPEIHSALVIAKAVHDQIKTLATLSLHQNRIHRAVLSSTEQLERIQTKRKAEEKEEMIIAGRIYMMKEKENKAAGREEPWDCAADGFVFTLDKIAASVRRAELISRACSAK
jgi:hypothetical protein